MLGKTKGIVLHSIKQGESGRIVKIYTQEFGLLSFYLRSTYSKKKGSTTALYQTFSHLNLDIDLKENQGLHLIRSAELAESGTSFQIDPISSCLALFMAEVFIKAVQEEETSEDLYSFLLHWVRKLETEAPKNIFPIQYLLSLAQPLGIYPDLESDGNVFDLRDGCFTFSSPLHKEALRGRVVDLLQTFHSIGLTSASDPNNTREVRRELVEALLLYFRIHIPQFNEIKSYAVLKEVFST